MRWIGLAILALHAQAPTGPPSFEPGDEEGLQVTRNPRIRHAWKRKVHWKLAAGNNWPAPAGVPARTAAERQAATAKLDQLAALLKATPEGTNGRGYWMNETRQQGYFDITTLDATVPVAKHPLEAGAGFFPFYHEDVQTNGVWKLSVNGETESVYYYFNRLPGRMQNKLIAPEPRPGGRAPVEFYTRPKITGRVQGLPVYDSAVLVVTRSGRDPWAAVGLERLLRAALPLAEKQKATAEARLAGLKKKNDEVQAAAWEKDFRDRFEKNNGSLRQTRPANYEARLRSMEHEIRYTREKAMAAASPKRDAAGQWYWNPVDTYNEMAAKLQSMSAAEATGAACFAEYKTQAERDGRYDLGGRILAAGSAAGCEPVVTENPQYFDYTLPRSKAQILTIADFGRCATIDGDKIVRAPVNRWTAPPQGCVRHAQIWREMDWTKFAALVDP